MALGRQNPDDWDIDAYDPTSEIDSSWSHEPAKEPPAANAELPVKIEIDNEGLVASVSLASEWKRALDPRELPDAVLTAVQTATMQLLAQNAEHVNAAPSREPSSPLVQDSSPLSAGDVQRLLEEVNADVDRFTERLSARLEPVSIASAGGHVRGSASKGQIHELSIDPKWSSSSRNAEIESELNEVLKRLSEESSPGGLTQGPQSRAISELNSLASDPQLFLRRIGLTPPS